MKWPMYLMSIVVASPLAVVAHGQDELSLQLEEVIVTATKREKSIIEVPLSVSALGEESLKRIAADNFDGFVRQIPGLTHNSNGASNAKFAIRGITTSTGQSNTQAPVALYIDELPVLDSFAPLASPDLRLFDINRVEVLRGPQGTLFGSGALGGAIRVITNKPNADEFHGRLNGSVTTVEGGEEAYAVNGMVNIPLMENKLALRAVVYSREGGGYIDNIVTGDNDVAAQDSVGGRLMLNWLPSEDLSVLFSVTAQNDDPDDRSFTVVNGPADQNDSAIQQPLTVDMLTGNIVVEYDFGSAYLTSSTTYSERDEEITSDAAVLGAAVAPFGVTSNVIGNNVGSGENFAQELRLASTGDTALEWLGGIFYKSTERDLVESITAAGVNDIFSVIGLPVAPVPPYPQDALFAAITTIETTEIALFGELTYHFTETISATAGLRWFDNDQDLTLAAAGLLAAGIAPTDRSSSESKVTPKFSVSYQPNDELHFYFSAAQGYRVGQSNFALPVIPGIPESPTDYDADSLWNYEIGAKANLLEGDLYLEAAAYFIDWEDIQLQQVNAANFVFITNAGEAESMGVELSANYSISDNWKIGTSLAVNDTELTSIENGVIAMAGDSLPGAADFKSATFVEWVDQISERATGYVRLDHQYSSDAYTQLSNATSPQTESYSVLNLNAGANFGNWQVGVFAKNLTDEDKITNIIVSLDGRGSGVRLRPREIGVSLDLRF